MFRCLNLLLLLCLIHYIESSGNTPRSVTGEQGGSVTLSCEFQDREISDIVLSRFSKIILVCHNEECESENGRLLKKGSCDVIIKDLRFTDAGKYILRVHYTNDQREPKQQTLQYHLHIHESKGKPDTDEDKSNDTEESVESWIIVLSPLIGALLVLLVLVICAVIWKHQCRHRDTEYDLYQRGVPMQDIVQ